MIKKVVKSSKKGISLVLLFLVLLLAVFVVNYSNNQFNLNKYAASNRCNYENSNQWCEGLKSYECSSDGYKILHVSCSNGYKCEQTQGGKTACVKRELSKPKQKPVKLYDRLRDAVKQKIVTPKYY